MKNVSCFSILLSLSLPGLFSPEARAEIRGERPFRTGVLKLNEGVDETKPVAAMDLSGWVVKDDLLVGPFDKNWLIGYSLKTRKPVWWLNLEAAAVTPFLAYENYIYAGLQNGAVVKISAQDGKAVWQTKLDAYVGQKFLVAGDVLYAFTVTQQLFAIDSTTGKTKWIYDAGEPESLLIGNASGPVLAGGTVLVGTSSGEIHQVDSASGKLNWSVKPDFNEGRFHDIVGNIVVNEQRIVFTRYDGFVGSFLTSDPEHQMIWEQKLPTITTNTEKNGALYIGHLNGDVTAYDAGNGNKSWTVSTGQAVLSIVAHENKLFVIGTNGRVTKVDAEKGVIGWNDDLEATVNKPPLLHDGRLYVSTGQKVFYGYKAR
ncbi:MAG: PQQ-binding-like beta-propeller repeat protein [Oligoflexales bacterium]